MSQQSVLEYIERNKRKWVTTNEIVNELNLSNSSVQVPLKILRKWELIQAKSVRRFIYKYKNK